MTFGSSLSELPIASNCRWPEGLGVPKPHSPLPTSKKYCNWSKPRRKPSRRLCTTYATLSGLGWWRWPPFDWEGGRGCSLRAKRRGQWMRGWSSWHVSQEWRNRQRPKGQWQRPSFQEWQYLLDRGLSEDARGSVTDKVEEVEELEVAEVLAGDLVCCCVAEKQVDLVVKLEC